MDNVKNIDPSANDPATSVVQTLRSDHKRVTGLFRQLEGVDVRAHEMKSGVLRQLAMELDIHARLEEEIFYPSVRIAVRGLTTDESTRALTTLDHSLSDHDEIKRLLSRINELDPDDEQVMQLVSELETQVQTHVEEEENVLFPFADRELKASGHELTRAIRERREELMKLPEYRDALPEVVQNPHGGEQMRKRTAA